jgi:hypothetical protein
MFGFYAQALRKRLRKVKGRGARSRKRPFGPKLTIELLEDRCVPSVTITGPSQQIPVGGVQAGQTISLDVDFSTTDAAGDFAQQEHEPLVIRGSDGFSTTISSYGRQTVQIPVREAGASYYASVDGGDGDEAGILVVNPTAKILINDTEDSSDNITLYNDDSTSEPYVQTIPAKIVNQGTAKETFQLVVEQAGAGNVTLSQQEITLDPGKNNSKEITITPTAVSSAARDVHILVKQGETTVAEDDMTVVGARIPIRIYNKDTPDAMLEAQAYRIPPYKATEIPIVVTPNLSGSGQSVTLTVTGPDLKSHNTNPLYGTATVNEHASATVASSGEVNLYGTDQTAPSRGGRNAGQLHLVLQVGGQSTIHSDGFSVAAIPVKWSERLLFKEENDLDVGFTTRASWTSDGGDPSLLSAVQIKELIEKGPATGFFIGDDTAPLDVGDNFWASKGAGEDPHTYPIESIAQALRHHPGNDRGSLRRLQVHVFSDNRTGVKDIPITNSGYVITDEAEQRGNGLYVTTTEKGERTTAQKITSDAGSTYPSPISSGPVHVKINDDPLVVTTQPPATVTAGTPFGLAVTAENADGSVNTSFAGSVTVANMGGGALSGTLTVNAVNGVATFSDLTLDQVGTYVLDASSSGLPDVLTNAFDVAAAPATQLITTGPAGPGAAGVPLGYFTVDAEDPFGNVDTTFTGSVTVALASNPGGAALGGTLTAAAVDGEATFSDLTVSIPGTGYTLRASSPGLTDGISSPFDVTDQLVVTTQPPSSVVAGSAFGLIVQAEDGLGHVDPSFSGSVTVAGYGVGGTLTVNAVNGVATFSDLSLTQAGTVFLDVSSGNLPDVTTNGFDVTAAPASQLVTAGPSGPAAAGAALGDFTVEAEDPFGNLDTSFAGSVTVALANNPGGAALGGTLTAAAVNGTVTFSVLTVSVPGSGYTLQASSPGLTAGISSPFDVTDQLVVTMQPPGGVIAGSTFGVVVQAEDGFGQVDPSFNGSVTVSDYGVGGTLTVNAVNGVATFPDLALNQAATYTLTFISGDLPPVETSPVVVSAAPATALVVSGPSGLTLPGVPFAVTVNAEDPYGNVDPAFNGSVTVALASNPSTAALGGTLTAAAVDGVATFSDLTLDKLGTGYTLQAAAAGLPGATSLPFDLTDQLVVTTPPPDSITAGTPFGLAVEIDRQSGEVDTSFQGAVTIALNNFSDGPTDLLRGTLTVAVAHGVATFSGLTLDQAGSYGLSVTGTATTEVALLLDVTPAAATRLAVTGSPPRVTVGADFPVTVAAQDPFGNVDTNFNGSVTLSLANNPGGAALGGDLTATAVNGVASFSNLTLDSPGNGYTLQAASPGLSAATTGPLNVSAPGVATQLVTSRPPSRVSAGSTFGLDVAAEDGFGTVDTTFNGSVTVAGGPLGGTLTVTAVNGVATFSDLTLDQAGSYALSVSGSGLAATTGPVNVIADPATQLVIVGTPTALTGAPFSLTIQAEDPYGNVDPNFNGDATLALGNNPGGATLGGTLSLSLSDGMASAFDLTISAPGNGYTLQATSAGLTTGISSPFDVTSDQLVVTTQPAATFLAGSSFGLTVSAEDGSGHVDTTFQGSVAVGLINFGTNSPTLSGTLTVTAVNGLATFSGLALDQPGFYALSVSSNGLPGAVTNFINVTTATQLQVSDPPPDAVTAGAPFAVTVRALDPAGNLDPTFTGSVTLALANNPGGGTLGGVVTVNAADGVAHFPDLTLSNPAVGYTLQATSGGLTAATTGPINVLPPGVATRLVMTTPPPAGLGAGTSFGLVVQAEDGFGSVDTTFNGSITLDPNNFSGPPISTLGGTPTVTAVNGVATFSGLVLDQAGTYSLSVAGAGLPATFTDLMTVTPAAATRLAVVPPGGNVLSGAPFALSVEAEDAYGNVDPTFVGSVTLALASNPGGGDLGGTLTVQAVNGVATFSDLAIGGPGSGYSIQATAAGLSAGTSAPFDVTNDQLVVTAQPPDGMTAGTPFGLVVAAEDGSGNLDTSFNGGVTVSNDFSGTLGGTLTVTAVSGVATFSGLTLDQAGYDMLAVTGSGLPAASTGLFSVAPAAATQLVASGPAGNVLTGSPFTVTASAEDPFGNVDPTFNGTVALALATNPAGATLGGTLNGTAVNGVASFSDLTITTPGGGYSLQAAALGLGAVTTSLFDVTNDQLVPITQPPASVPAGTSFGLAVQAEDGSGAVDSGFSGSVTLYDSDTGTALAQTTAVNGVATFSTLILDQAGTHLLAASSSGLGGAAFDPLNVAAGAATQLVVTSEPSAVAPGAAFKVDVAAADPFGNIDPTFTGGVTVALDNNPGSATLGGTLAVNAAGGVATFADLALDNPGTNYTLQASSNGLNPATTDGIDVGTTVASTTTTLTSDQPSGSVYGQAVAITAAVNGNGSSPGTPTGTVQFQVDGSDFGSPITLANGNASISVAGLAAGTHEVTAVYGGDATFQGGTGTLSGGQAVTPAPLTITADDQSMVYGGAMPALSATYGGLVNGDTPATFTVSPNAAPALATVPATSHAGAYAITVSGASDPNYSITFVSGTLTVTPAPITITADDKSKVYGDPLPAFTVSYSGFVNGDTPAALGGTLTFTTAASASSDAGTYAIAPGGLTSSDYAIGYANGTLTVTPAPSGTALSTSLGSPYYGQAVTLTATVSGGPAPGTPTGSVSFLDGAVLLGTAPLDNTGTAALQVSNLPAGTASITAAYGGDTDFLGSTSAAVTETVQPDSTTTAVVSPSVLRAVYGQPVVLTTLVSNANTSATPAGTVTFKDGSTVLGTATLDAGGTAALTVTTLAVGRHPSLTASFSDPAGNFLASATAKAASVTVGRANTSTALSATTSAAVYSQEVTFTATVTADAPSVATPGGTVTFKDGSRTLATVPLTNGAASYTTSALALGSHSVTAFYARTSTFLASTSVASPVSVSQDGTTTTLSSSVSDPVYGESVTLQATVAAAAPGTGTPEGTVTFYDGATKVGTARVRKGVATLTTSFKVVGGHSLTAVFSSRTANFGDSTSAALLLAVAQDATATTLTGSTTSATFGKPVTFTATVKAAAPGSGTPTGPVTFYDVASGGAKTMLGVGSLNSKGVASFATSSLGRGKHDIEADYGGDPNFLGSASALFSLTVG